MKILPLSSHKKFLLIRRFHRSRFYPNRRNAKKFLIGALIFVAVQIGLFIIIKPFSARAAWYDANYGYRQAITITNNGSLQSNYVVEVNVDTQTLIAAGKMQSDCDDIRFTSSDGSTLQNFFIDYCSNTASVNSSIFVKVGSIAASTTTTLYMYYGYGSATSGASAYSSIGAPTGIWLGTGKDGAISVTADTNINTADTISGRACGDTTGGDAVIYTSTDNVAAADTTIDLATNPSDPSCLTAGDEVLIFNAQGTSSATGDGKYEFARISSISTNVLTLNHALTNAYNGTNRKLVVQRVPNYTSVTLSNAGTDFTPSAWDGTKGGVMAFRSSGTVTVAASTTINANALGYTGGTAGTLTEVGGNAGESYDGPSTGRGGNGSTNGQTRGGGNSGNGGTASPADGGTATGAGGGGGSDGSANNTDGSAGAGGGGGYAGGGGGGAGGTDATTTTGRNGGTGGSAGTQAGGGGGGCADSNTNTVGAGGNAGSNGGTSTGCGSGNGAGGAAGTSGNQASGGGGSTSAGSGGGGGGGGYYGIANLTTLYFGSGGGGGGARDDGADGGNGGAGGGIVYVNASTISVSGSITSTGANGSTASTGGGNGGGGAGGSILLRTITDTGTWTAIVTALGGNGGGASTDRPDGGDGGNGRMHFDYTDSGAPGSGSPTADTSQVPYSDSPTSELSYADYQASFNISTTWKFDEGYGTTAYDSINTTSPNNGTLAGTTTPAWKTTEYCVFGNCLYFEGTTAKVTLANDQTVKSVSMWIRPTSFASTMGLVDLGNSVRITVDTSGVMTATGFTSATKYINGLSCSTCTLTLNKWQHIEVVDTTAVSATSMVLGNYSTNFFKGFMDEVRMNASADSALQAKANYNARGSTKGTSTSIGGDLKFLSDGLTGYWEMDESSWTSNCSTAEVIDSSGNGNNGISCPNGAANDPLVGKFGNAGDFDGSNDYAEVADTNSLDVVNFTVSAWIYMDNAPGSEDAIVSKHDGTNFYQLDMLSDRTLKCYASGYTPNTTTSVSIVALSTWTHVSCTVENGIMRIFVNGILDKTEKLSGSRDSTNTAVLRIGNSSNDASREFDGRIDDLRIYNRALSPAEVSQLYSWAPGPISYWKLDEASLGTPNCSTSVVSDSSGNGHSGTACPNSTGPKGGAIGKFGRSVNFDGSDDFINITDDAVYDIDVTKDYTWSMWIKPTSFVEGNWQTIWSQTKIGSEPNFLMYAMNIDGSGTGEPEWGPVTNGISVGWDHGSNQLMTHTNNNVLSTGIWSYVTVTYDHTQSQSSRLKIYINGVDQTDTSDIHSAGTIGNIATTHTRIGNNENYGEYFPGQIDDVKIYNYRRSAKQIISDMNADHPIVGTPVAGPVGHWKFDEGALNTCTGGDDFCDTTPNANDLTYSTTTGGITQSGKFGKAYDGANNTRATRNDDSDFDFSNGTDEFTISAWFNRGGAISNAEYLVDKHSTNDGYTLYMDSDGDIVCGIGDGAASFPEETIGGSLSKNYDDTSWHHAVCVKEGTTALRLYVDGIEIASDTSLAVTDDMSNSGKLIIADANETDGTDEWLGDIDEVKIYRAALNAQDVKLEYNQGKSIVLGALSTDASSNTDNSASRTYCPPGNIEGNCASGQNPAPVLEWKFETTSGTTVYDTSGNNLNGTWNSTRNNYFSPGKYGKASNFIALAGDKAYVADNSLLDFSTTFSLEAWFYPNGSDGAIAVKWNGDPSSDQASYYLGYDTGEIYIGIDSDGDAFSGPGSQCFSGTSGAGITNGTWYHAVLTYNAGTANVYVNGRQIMTTASCPNTIYNGSANFAVGNIDDPGVTSMNGKIDQVLAYNYVRTPSQIAWDYNRGRPSAWYKFDECSGTTINDASGNSYSGTQAGTTAGTCSTASSFRGGASGDSTTNSGKINYAGTFDGSNDRVTTSAFSPLASAALTTTKVSWGGWFYPTSFSARKTLMEKATELRLDTDTSGNAICDIYTGGAFTSYAPTTTTLTSSAWNHVLCVYNGSNVLTYINGALKNTSASQTGNITAASSVLHIGQNSSSAQRYTGRIDDVRIYNFDLSNQQIKVIYNGDSAVRFAPLTGTPQ